MSRLYNILNVLTDAERKTAVWTNSNQNPVQSFGAQTITGLSLSGYDYVDILDELGIMHRVKVGYDGYLYHSNLSGGTGLGYVQVQGRKFTVNSTSVVIGKGYGNYSNNASAVENSYAFIPMAIFGIKT